MKILLKKLNKYDKTVRIIICKKSDEKLKIYIRIINNIYPLDSECLIYINPIINPKITKSDLDNYKKRVKKILKESKNFINSIYKIEYINSSYMLKIFDDKVILSKINKNLININSLPHHLKYYDIKVFNTLEEAQSFITSTVNINF